MTTLYPLTSTQALSNLRIDLSDTDPASYRWPDSALNRALDKANERYSRVNPWMQAQDVATVPLCCLYPWPAGAFFIDRLEYPQGRWPKQFFPFLERKSPLTPAPNWNIQPNSAPPDVLLQAGGNLSNGSYQWAVSYTVPGGGETTPSTLFPSVPLAASAGKEAVIMNLPVGPYGVSGRNVYRTKAGGSTLYLAGSLSDNFSTAFTDTTSDASLVTPAPNANSTANLDQFELIIPPELWPPDSTRLIEITYSSKHHLDADGTTIPERHWDVLFQGAIAYAMFSYLPQVNDNFVYSDGHLHDRVDDTASTIAWQTQCRVAMEDFEKMLVQIKEEGNAGVVGNVPHWGGKPLRWERV